MTEPETDTVAIRRARPGDEGAIFAAATGLARHLGMEDKLRATPEALARHAFAERPVFRVLLAEAGGELAGVACFFPDFSTLRGAPGVFLLDLWLPEARRGAGLGQRLIAAVAREAEAWGAAYMKLAAHVENTGAIRFYHRLGFETEDDERTLSIEGAGFQRLKGEA